MNRAVKRIISVVTVLTMLALTLPLSACSNGGKQDETTPEATTVAETTEIPAPENSLLLYDGESFLFSLVRAEKAGSMIVGAFTDLRASLSGLFDNAKIEMTDDFIKNESEIGEHEIVIGNTNRPITKKLTDKMGVMSSFEILVEEGGIAICGTSDLLTEEGVKYFTTTYLPENMVKAGDKVYLKYGSYSSDKKTPSFGQYLDYCNKNNVECSFTSEELFRIPAVRDHNILQGGCIDSEGKYAYFLFHKNNVSSIAKYDFASGTLVESKYKIGTDHSNDACFNSKLNAVVVVHNAPNYKLISMFDADTLERKGEIITFEKNIYSIAYDEATDRYVVGLSGDYNFAVLDSNFKIIAEYEGVKTGYTRQGVDADREYIYFVQSTGVSQYIVVYTWSGEHVGTKPLTKIFNEVEHAFHIGNQLYISCYLGSGKGGVTYKINLNIE